MIFFMPAQHPPSSTTTPYHSPVIHFLRFSLFSASFILCHLDIPPTAYTTISPYIFTACRHFSSRHPSLITLPVARPFSFIFFAFAIHSTISARHFRLIVLLCRAIINDISAIFYHSPIPVSIRLLIIHTTLPSSTIYFRADADARHYLHRFPPFA